MSITLDPQQVTPLHDETGEVVTYAFIADDASLITRVGGVTLGVPAEVEGKLVFDHAFPEAALERLREKNPKARLPSREG